MPKPASSTDKKSFVEWVSPYLILAGILTESSVAEKLLVTYHIIALLVSSSLGWAQFCLNYDNFSVNTEILLHAVLAAHTLFVYLIYLRKRKTFSDITKTMRDRFHSLSDKIDLTKYTYVWEKADEKSLSLMKLGLNLAIICDCFYIFNAKPFSDQRKLLYPMWVPLSLHEDLSYFLTVLFQVSVFFLYNLVHVCGCSLFIGGSHFIGAALDVLGLAFTDISRLKETKNHRSMDQTAVQGFETAHRKLNLWIESHVSVLSFTNNYKSVLEDVLLEVMLCCEFLICFAGFQVVLAVELKDAEKAANLVGMSLVMALHLFMFCYPGQYVFNKCERLRDTIYCSPWDIESPHFRRHLAFVLNYTGRPINMSFKGVVHSSMQSFSQALRKAYSYISILLIMRNVQPNIQFTDNLQ